MSTTPQAAPATPTDLTTLSDADLEAEIERLRAESHRRRVTKATALVKTAAEVLAQLDEDGVKAAVIEAGFEHLLEDFYYESPGLAQ